MKFGALHSDPIVNLGLRIGGLGMVEFCREDWAFGVYTTFEWRASERAHRVLWL